jgi:GAF domain-containing protein
MPYVRCWSCRLTTYCPRGQLGRAECPGCGSLLIAPSEEDGDRGSGTVARTAPEEGLDRALMLAYRELDMDAALLTEIRDGREVVRRSAGETAPFGALNGASMPIDDTYCTRLLEGRTGEVVPDTEADARTRDLPVTKSAGIGSYIGVRLTGENARLYVLCCLARESRPALGQSDLRFLRGLAESVGAALRDRRA